MCTMFFLIAHIWVGSKSDKAGKNISGLVSIHSFYSTVQGILIAEIVVQVCSNRSISKMDIYKIFGQFNNIG